MIIMSNRKCYKITKHASIRMKERTKFNHKERYYLFKKAIKYGKNPQDIKDESLQGYMYSKRRNAYIKLYRGYIFIYSRNTKRLYTMYELPKCFKESEAGDCD